MGGISPEDLAEAMNARARDERERHELRRNPPNDAPSLFDSIKGHYDDAAGRSEK